MNDLDFYYLILLMPLTSRALPIPQRAPIKKEKCTENISTTTQAKFNKPISKYNDNHL